MKKFISILFLSFIPFVSNAEIYFDHLKDIAPVLILNSKGGVITSYLNPYISSKSIEKLGNKHFILPIVITPNDKEYFSINTICTIIPKKEVQGLRSYSNGENALNLILKFLQKEESFTPNIVTLCMFEKSGFSQLFLNGLPRSGKAQFSLYTLQNKSTLHTTSAIWINNADSGKKQTLYLFNK